MKPKDRADWPHLPRPPDAVLAAIAIGYGDEPCAERLEVAARHAPAFAIHEAGHAVADVASFGVRVVRIATIVPDPGSGKGGYVCFDVDRSGQDPMQYVRTVGACCYAGVAAEFTAEFAPVEEDEELALELERDPALARFIASEHDRLELECVAAELGQSVPAKQWHTSYWDAALRLLRLRWHAVHALASSLLTDGTLYGIQVDRIVTEALHDGQRHNGAQARFGGYQARGRL